jgi:Rod binding domain-containing protein
VIDPISPTASTPTPAAAKAVDPKLRAAAEAFEQQLIEQLTQQLQSSVSSLGGGDGSDDDSGDSGEGGLGAYQELLPQALAQSLQRAGGLGLADELTRALESRS